MSPCQIAAADRRLRDAYERWRRMERSYFDPYEFRLNLNSFVQEARNVSFILQTSKGRIPEFDSWYRGWQERMRGDAIMRWAVAARNKVTKQGDLEAGSRSLVTFTADWTDERTMRFRAKAFVPSAVLIEQARAKVPRELITEESLFCVEREWVDDALPDDELLRATSHVLRVLSELVEDAHAYIGTVISGHRCDLRESLVDMRREYPFHLARGRSMRRLWVKAGSRQKLKYTVGAENVSVEDAAAAGQRYGIGKTSEKGSSPNSLEGAVTTFLDAAKKILGHDGYLVPFLFVYGDDGHLTMLRLQMEDRAEKHIAIRQAADFLSSMTVKWAILVNEAWLLRLEKGEEIKGHAADSPKRAEAVVADGVSSDGRFYGKVVPFRRYKREIIFEDRREASAPSNILLPILKAIRRDERESGVQKTPPTAGV